MKFVKANEYIKSKVIVPTNMDSSDLAMSETFNAQVKAHCFFSAKVTSANVLEALKKEVEAFTAGETDMASARMRLKSFLQRQGIMPDIPTAEAPEGVSEEEFKARKSITNLASTRRLNMILETNAKMAQATARYQYDMHPEMLERFPCFEYDAMGDARSSHLSLDGLILAKEDPFWYTHTPPWEYGCRCAIYNSDAKPTAKTANINADTQTGKLFFKGRVQELKANDSGFTFRIDEAFKVANMSMVNSVPLRRSVLDRLHQLTKKSQTKINVVSGVGKGEVDPQLPTNTKEIEAVFDEIAKTNSFKADKISLGKLLPEFADGLGIEPVEVMFSQGKAKYGLKHYMKHHKTLLKANGVLDVLKASIWNKNAMSVVSLSGKHQRMLIIDPKSKSYSTLVKVGVLWQLELASAAVYDQNKIDVDLILGYESEREQNR